MKTIILTLTTTCTAEYAFAFRLSLQVECTCDTVKPLILGQLMSTLLVPTELLLLLLLRKLLLHMNSKLKHQQKAVSYLSYLILSDFSTTMLSSSSYKQHQSNLQAGYIMQGKPCIHARNAHSNSNSTQATMQCPVHSYQRKTTKHPASDSSTPSLAQQENSFIVINRRLMQR